MMRWSVAVNPSGRLTSDGDVSTTVFAKTETEFNKNKLMKKKFNNATKYKEEEEIKNMDFDVYNFFGDQKN